MGRLNIEDHPPVPGRWYACEYPERPADAATAYARSADCDACFIAAQADARRKPDAMCLSPSDLVETMAENVESWRAERDAR